MKNNFIPLTVKKISNIFGAKLKAYAWETATNRSVIQEIHKILSNNNEEIKQNKEEIKSIKIEFKNQLELLYKLANTLESRIFKVLSILS